VSQQRGVLVVEELANHHHSGEEMMERSDHDEWHRRRVLDLRAHTTGGGETRGNGEVQQRGSQIGARFGRR
jgi:hypothetical protein